MLEIRSVCLTKQANITGYDGAKVSLGVNLVILLFFYFSQCFNSFSNLYTIHCKIINLGTKQLQ